jgi:hypothetical protein
MSRYADAIHRLEGTDREYVSTLHTLLTKALPHVLNSDTFTSSAEHGRLIADIREALK